MKDADIMIVVGAMLGAAILATGQQTGNEWKLRYAGDSDRVHFSVDRYTRFSHWAFGSDVPLSRFRGFSLSMLDLGGPAKFEYVADAGKLVCKGNFSWSRGTGTFTFVPSPEFAAEMTKLGYDAPTADQAFDMMASNVGLDFARGIRDAGLEASTSQLLQLHNHGLTLDYIRDVQRAGYRDFRAQDYIDVRNHGVTADFLHDLKTAGYNLTSRQIIDLRMHGVNAEFMGDLKQAGYDLPVGEITELRMHGVDGRFVGDLKTYGLHPKASDLVQFKMHGVTPEFLRELKDSGYGEISEEQIVQLRNHGVGPEFIREASAMGYRFTPQELTDLQMHGVNADYLRRLKESGMRNLDAQQIAKLKMHGVD